MTRRSRPRRSDHGRPPTHRQTDRAVSTAIGYALSLTITAMVMSGLLITAGDVVETQREQSIRAELEVVGQQVSSHLLAADRLASTTDDTVTVRFSIPLTVADTSYLVEVDDGGGSDPHLILSTNDPEVSVRVDATVRTDLVESSVSGGDVAIVYDGASDDLEVRRG